jgi:hypothetical protein
MASVGREALGSIPPLETGEALAKLEMARTPMSLARPASQDPRTACGQSAIVAMPMAPNNE